MLKNAYFLAKIGADTAENERNFAEILPIGRRRPTGLLPSVGVWRGRLTPAEGGGASLPAGSGPRRVGGFKELPWFVKADKTRLRMQPKALRLSREHARFLPNASTRFVHACTAATLALPSPRPRRCSSYLSSSASPRRFTRWQVRGQRENRTVKVRR